MTAPIKSNGNCAVCHLTQADPCPVNNPNCPCSERLAVFWPALAQAAARVLLHTPRGVLGENELERALIHLRNVVEGMDHYEFKPPLDSGSVFEALRRSMAYLYAARNEAKTDSHWRDGLDAQIAMNEKALGTATPERVNGLAPPAIVSCGVCVNTGKVNGEVCPYCKGETATPAADTSEPTR